MSSYLKVDRSVLLFSLRYALSRESYAPYLVVDNIKYNIDAISSHDIEMYIRDIKEACDTNPNCDKEYWMGVIAYLEGVLNSRLK